LPSEIGSNFLGGGSLSLSYTDTLTLKVSTVIFDSVSTLQSSRLLTGYVEDPQIGKIYASPYFRLNPVTVQSLDSDFDFEYLALRLEYDRYSYYDTTRQMTLHVFQIDEDIETEDDGRLYNNRVFRKKRTNGQVVPLGSLSFNPSPNRFDTLEIKLADSFGKELFQLVKDGDDKVTVENDFLDFIKGITLESDTSTSSCFVGFKPNASLRLHYVNNNEVPKRKAYIDFSFQSNLYYNQIRSNRQSTSLADLTTREKPLSTLKTSNVTYLNSGIGLGIRVEIPHLRSILSLDKNLIISQAQLKIVPLDNTYGDNTPLPGRYAIYAVDKFNDIYGAYQNSLVLLKDDLLDRDTHYIADVTNFVKSQLSNDLTNQNALLFFPANPGSSVDRVYAGDGNSKYSMELKIYYTQIN
jgi:hypothetical protein